MNHPVWQRSVLVGTIAAMLAGPVFATSVDLSGANGEETVQDILDGITQPSDTNVSGTSSIDASGDQINQDELWSLAASGSANFTLITEIASDSYFNSFGVYDVFDTDKRVVLFDGDDSSGDFATLTLFDLDLNGQDYMVYVNGNDSGVSFDQNQFGYFLETPSGIWYSDPSNNWDGVDNLVVYQGNDTDIVRLPYRPDGLWTDNEFILAWEDSWNIDRDFNDFVTMVESVVPVTEPSTLALFGISLLGIGVLSRRRKQH